MATEAKSTAQLATLARAVASFEADPRIRVPDHLAIRFLDPVLARVARSRSLRRIAVRFYERRLPGAYLYTIARTRYIDEVLSRELESGTDQVVVLGAGYDSRAYRFHDAFPKARFFEVDYPPTSARKVAKVAAVLGVLPDHVSYLPVDLTVDTLDATLPGTGYDPDHRTLFIWEGVTMYLTAVAIDDTLAFVRARSGAGSSIVFDYVFQSILAGDSTLYGAAEAVRLVRKRREPFLFGIEAGGAGRFLREHGLECVADLGPADLEQIYFSRGNGTFLGRVVGYWGIVHGRRTSA